MLKGDIEILKLTKKVRSDTEIPNNFTGIAEWHTGTKEWFKEDRYHRLDGPAVEYICGDKEWWVDGKRHRLDGPAIEYFDGYKEWWVVGKEVTEKDFPKTVLDYKLKMVLES